MTDTRETKPALLGKTLPELAEIARQLGMQPFVAAQLAYWLYKTQVASFDEMTNISKKNQSLLASAFSLGTSAPVKVSVSSDGTRKYLFETKGRYIETAFIPEATRNTLCVSSQAGCKMGCLFCATGRQGFQANLPVDEILNQLRSIPEWESITNVVFMGMGEPLDNLSAVMKAQHLLTDEQGFGLSIRKVTVSTVGIIPAMQVFLRESKCNLALSLHTPFDDERQKLMPVNHVYPIRQVIEAINGSAPDKYRRISIEYIVFGGLNDTPRHVKELARLLNRTRCRINLIRFHPVAGVPLPPTDEARLMDFQQALQAKGIVTTIRASRGLDIEAACGLLSTYEYVKQKGPKPSVPASTTSETLLHHE